MPIDLAETSADDGAPFDGGTTIHVDGTDVVGPAAAGTALQPLGPLDRLKAALAVFREKYATYTPDLSTKEGEAIARANRKELVTLRTSTEKAYEQINGPLLAIQRDARALKKQIQDEVEKYETPIDAEIKRVEAEREAEAARKKEAERLRLQAIRQKMTDISAIPMGHVRSNVDQLKAAIGALGETVISEEEFGDFAEDAAAVLEHALAELGNLLTAAEERAAAEARAEEVRQQAEAARQAEDARLAAERAELDRQRQELAAAQEQVRLAAAAAAEEQRVAQARAEEERLAADRRAAAARQAEADAAAERQRLAEEASAAQAALLKTQVDAFNEDRARANREIEEERAALRAQREEMAAAAAPAPQPEVAVEAPAAEPEPAMERDAASVFFSLVQEQDADQFLDTLDLPDNVTPIGAAAPDFDLVPDDSATRPSDADIIELVASTYDVSIADAIEYIAAIDIAAARATLEQAA